MKIGVIGGGIVGTATARCFVEHGEVFVYDTKAELATDTYEATVNSDLIFVCLPTPLNYSTGWLDTSYLDKFFAGVAGSERVYVLKSTVPVGTTDRLRKEHGLPNLIHSPEFLTARCANTDAQLPSRNIIGAPECAGKKVYTELLWSRFPGVQIFHVLPVESELVKLVCNSFFAVKIAFFNEANELAATVGADWSNVLSCVMSDGRIAHSHTRVPGPAGHFGFGGTCLPKDLACFITESQSRGLSAAVSLGANNRNKYDRRR